MKASAIYGERLTAQKKLEDIFIEKIQDSLNIRIIYKKKEGNVFTGIKFSGVDIYRDEKKILYIKKLKIYPNIKGTKNLLSLLTSFSISLYEPVFYLQNEGVKFSFNYNYNFSNLKNYKLEIKIINGKIINFYYKKYKDIKINGYVLWNKTLSFRNFVVSARDSYIKLEGSLDILHKKSDKILRIWGKKVPSLIPFYYKGYMDFNLSLYFINERPKFKGSVTLYDGSLFIKSAENIENLKINPELDISLKVEKNFKVIGGNSYTLWGKGYLKITSSLKVPKIIGTFVVDGGKILFGTTYFRVSNGKIEFTEYTYLDPLLSIDTQGNIDGIQIFAHISGFSRTSKVSLSSIPSFSQDELSSIIAMGKKLKDYDRKDLNDFLFEEALNMGVRSLSLSFMNSMDRIGRKYFGLDTFYLEPSFEIYSENIIKTKLSLKVGKYIGEDFYLKYERVLTPYVDDIFGFEFHPIKGFYIDFTLDGKNSPQIELIYEYTF